MIEDQGNIKAKCEQTAGDVRGMKIEQRGLKGKVHECKENTTQPEEMQNKRESGQCREAKGEMSDVRKEE